MSLRVLSLFSGVGGFDLGLERAGMTTVAQVEWDPKCQSVLRRHWPNVPKWHDVADVRGADLPDCDLVAFGSPCQDLSVAGKRAGMVAGETRSGLFFEAIRIIKELQEDGRPPAWVVWENVVGALSSNRGHDFAAVLDALGELGAVDIQWRVLDAQHFGVPQRRRRVFVVARLDPGAIGRPQVLPLGEGVRRNPASCDEAGANASNGASEGARTGSRLVDCATTMTLEQQVEVWSFDSTWSGAYGVCADQTPPMKCGGGTVPAIAGEVVAPQAVDLYDETTSDVMPTMRGGAGGGNTMPHVIDLAVRRLTPRECERLMGWPDDWTRWTSDDKEVADSNRYRMCGNGVASPVAEWIGRCILDAEGGVA
jgi:DNA (cytosine-5)-methyltransferase 1